MNRLSQVSSSKNNLKTTTFVCAYSLLPCIFSTPSAKRTFIVGEARFELAKPPKRQEGYEPSPI